MNNIKDIINSLNDSLENLHVAFVDDVGDVYAVSDETIKNIIALLKEQEAVEPKKTAYQRVDHTIAYRYRCGTCDMSIFPSYKYCPFCGQAVKWDA